MLYMKKIACTSLLSLGVLAGGSFMGNTTALADSPFPKNWENNLTILEKQTIKDYTHFHYALINSHLRNGNPIDLKTNEGMIILNIDNALRKGSISTDIIVYKHLASGKSLGLDFKASKNDKEYIKKAINILKNNINKIIIRPDYLSTTLDKTGKESELSGKIRMEINVPKGTHAADISGISEYPEEQEILLPRNSKIKIRDVSTTTEEGSEIIILKVDLIS
ncbi:ADP-ribosyltransferase [Bacillus thuringiensis]|uniref:ADP-ribosyltransferase n=1 Tax=Bacillus thuringiensis TaxID=1428 RepID=UPI0034580F38